MDPAIEIHLMCGSASLSCRASGVVVCPPAPTPRDPPIHARLVAGDGGRYHHVLQRHGFIPEGGGVLVRPWFLSRSRAHAGLGLSCLAGAAFSTDLSIHWGNSPLRPELAESTYLLHRATGDPFYLDVGRDIVVSLNRHARVKCGFASIKDVRRWEREDQMVRRPRVPRCIVQPR